MLSKSLIFALTDQNPFVRENAASVLGAIGDKEAFEALLLAITDQNSSVRESAVMALGMIGSEKTVVTLIQSINDPISSVRWTAKWALEKMSESDRNLPTLTQQLPHLLTLIPTESSQQALSVITAIQARCKYYNYNIAQTPLPPEDDPNSRIGNTYNFHGKVEQVFAGNPTVQGDNIATQNNQKTVPDS